LAQRKHEGDLSLRCRAASHREICPLAGEGFIITRCPEYDDERFARLSPDAEVLNNPSPDLR
jgi:hypothetical protein